MKLHVLLELPRAQNIIFCSMKDFFQDLMKKGCKKNKFNKAMDAKAGSERGDKRISIPCLQRADFVHFQILAWSNPQQRELIRFWVLRPQAHIRFYYFLFMSPCKMEIPSNVNKILACTNI